MSLESQGQLASRPEWRDAPLPQNPKKGPMIAISRKIDSLVPLVDGVVVDEGGLDLEGAQEAVVL